MNSIASLRAGFGHFVQNRLQVQLWARRAILGAQIDVLRLQVLVRQIGEQFPGPVQGRSLLETAEAFLRRRQLPTAHWIAFFIHLRQLFKASALSGLAAHELAHLDIPVTIQLGSFVVRNSYGRAGTGPTDFI
jgi:hypothetical protein